MTRESHVDTYFPLQDVTSSIYLIKHIIITSKYIVQDDQRPESRTQLQLKLSVISMNAGFIPPALNDECILCSFIYYNAAEVIPFIIFGHAKILYKSRGLNYAAALLAGLFVRSVPRSTQQSGLKKSDQTSHSFWEAPGVGITEMGSERICACFRLHTISVVSRGLETVEKELHTL